MSNEGSPENPVIPRDVEDQFPGEWLALDAQTQELIGHAEKLRQVVQLAKIAQAQGHADYFHHVLRPGTVLVGGLNHAVSDVGKSFEMSRTISATADPLRFSKGHENRRGSAVAEIKLSSVTVKTQPKVLHFEHPCHPSVSTKAAD